MKGAQCIASKTGWWRALLLAVVVAVAYGNSLGGGFHFDDWHVLEKNPHVRSLASIPRFFVDPDTTTVLHENKDLRPILMTTFALNWALSGSATWSYHLLNLVLHWLVVLLVLRIVRDHLWLPPDCADAVALVAALLVAVHPLGTETLNYLSARSSLLTTLFYLAAFDASLRGRNRIAVPLLALAMLTKAIAISLPLVLIAYRAVAPRSSPLGARRPSWGAIVSLAIVAVLGVVYRAMLLPPWTVASTHGAHVTPIMYFMTEWSAYLYYVRLFLWPDALVVDRLDYPVVQSFLEPRAWASLLVLGTAAVAAWRARRRWPWLTFALCWYVLTLAPESTFFPLAEPVNEHRPYLAMLGLATASAWGIWTLTRMLSDRLGTVPARLLPVPLALLVIGFAPVTMARNRVWHDDYLLWLDATRTAPRNARAWLNAGHAAMRRGRLDEAERLLWTANGLSPCYSYVQMNLSALAARQGDAAASLRWAEEAVRCTPKKPLVHHYHGAALQRVGRRDDALAAFERATAIDDQLADAWVAAARILEQGGVWAAAARAYDRAFAANPRYVEAGTNAGVIYRRRLGNPARAVELFETILVTVPGHYGATYQLAVALLAAGRTAEAQETWARFAEMAVAAGDETSLASAPADLSSKTAR